MDGKEVFVLVEGPTALEIYSNEQEARGSEAELFAQDPESNVCVLRAWSCERMILTESWELVNEDGWLIPLYDVVPRGCRTKDRKKWKFEKE